MATLNGQNVTFDRLSFEDVGRCLLAASPNKDGKGIRLELTPKEEGVLESVGGMTVGYSLVDLIADAIREKGGSDPTGLCYRYSNRVFTT
jgi:hypothetical protein